MALRSQSFNNAYRSFQSTGFLKTTLSSYSSSLSNKYQSAEDKIIDDNFREGLISTEKYLEYLQDRLVRPGNTPLQSENLKIKIRETQETFEDEKVQAAYETGGLYKGYKVDDQFLYEWERIKLEDMDPNSTVYQTQLSKVQNLKDRWETTERSDYRRQRLLEISQMPDSNINVLEQKVALYEELANQAESDGDIGQADTFRTYANNYRETLGKAKLSEKERNETRSIDQQYSQSEQQIRYGDSAQSGPSGVQVPQNQQGPVQDAPVQQGQGFQQAPSLPEGYPEADPEAGWLDSIVGNLLSISEEFNNLDFSNISQFYTQDDYNDLAKRSSAYNNKLKSIALAENSAEEKLAGAQKYADLAAEADANGFVDTAANYARKAQDLADGATSDYNKAQSYIADLSVAQADLAEAQRSANKRAVSRFFSERVDQLEYNNKELTNSMRDFSFTRKAGFNEGQIDPETGQPLTVKDVYLQIYAANMQAISDLYEVEGEVYDVLLNDPIEARNSKEKAMNKRSSVEKATYMRDNPDEFEIVVDRKGNVNIVDITDKLVKDQNGVSKFDKLNTKIGYVYYPLDIKYNKDGGRKEDYSKGDPVPEKEYLDSLEDKDYKKYVASTNLFVDKTTVDPNTGKEVTKQEKVEIPFKLQTKKLDDGTFSFAAVPDLSISEQKSKLGTAILGLQLNLAEKGFTDTIKEIIPAFNENKDFKFDESAAGMLIDAVKKPFEGGLSGVVSSMFNAIDGIVNKKAYAAEDSKFLSPLGKGGQSTLGLDLPMDMTLEEFDKLKENKKRISSLSGAPKEYADMIMKAANKYGVRPELLAGLLQHESGFNPFADNGLDRGIAQINRQAWPDISDEQAFDPEFAIDWAAGHIADLTKSTGSEFNALRAYNGGPNFASSRIGYDGRRTVNDITLNYANSVLGASNNFKVEQSYEAPTQQVYGPITKEQAISQGWKPDSSMYKNTFSTSIPGLRSLETPVVQDVSKYIQEESPEIDLSKLRSNISSSFDNLRSNVSSKVQDVQKQFQSNQRAVTNSPILQQAAVNLDKSIRGAGDYLSNLGSNIKSGASDLYNKAKNTASSLYDKLKNSLGGLFK